jgi:hypothetical protein
MERPALGYLTPKRGYSPAFLNTPKQEPTYILAGGGELSPGLRLTTLYAESTPLYTPPQDLGDAYWPHLPPGQSPGTPVRRAPPPERTLLVERLPHHAHSYLVTPERQPLDFLSPERVRHGSGPDSGKRGRPRADIITNLRVEGAQSSNPIKCHICSRY